jgi:hypothetical protein
MQANRISLTVFNLTYIGLGSVRCFAPTILLKILDVPSDYCSLPGYRGKRIMGLKNPEKPKEECYA